MDQLLKFINNLNTAQRAVIIGGFSLLFILLDEGEVCSDYGKNNLQF